MLGAPPSPRPPPRLAHRVARRPTSARSVVVHARPCAYWPLDGRAPRDGATTSLPPMVSAAVRHPGSARTPEHRSRGGSLTTATGDDRWQAELRQAWRIRAESTGVSLPNICFMPAPPLCRMQQHEQWHRRRLVRTRSPRQATATTARSHWHPLGARRCPRGALHPPPGVLAQGASSRPGWQCRHEAHRDQDLGDAGSSPMARLGSTCARLVWRATGCIRRPRFRDGGRGRGEARGDALHRLTGRRSSRPQYTVEVARRKKNA